MIDGVGLSPTLILGARQSRQEGHIRSREEAGAPGGWRVAVAGG